MPGERQRCYASHLTFFLVFWVFFLQLRWQNNKIPFLPKCVHVSHPSLRGKFFQAAFAWEWGSIKEIWSVFCHNFSCKALFHSAWILQDSNGCFQRLTTSNRAYSNETDPGFASGRPRPESLFLQVPNPKIPPVCFAQRLFARFWKNLPIGPKSPTGTAIGISGHFCLWTTVGESA